MLYSPLFYFLVTASSLEAALDSSIGMEDPAHLYRHRGFKPETPDRVHWSSLVSHHQSRALIVPSGIACGTLIMATGRSGQLYSEKGYLTLINHRRLTPRSDCTRSPVEEQVIRMPEHLDECLDTLQPAPGYIQCGAPQR